MAESPVQLTAGWVRNCYARQTTTPGMDYVLSSQTIQEIIQLSHILELYLMTMVQIDQAELDAFGQKFEQCAVVLANEVNTLIGNAVAAGTPLPDADVSAVNKALADLQAIPSLPTPAPAPAPAPTPAPPATA